MFDLTSTSLFVVATAVAACLPLVIGLRWARADRWSMAPRALTRRRAWVRMATRIVTVLLAQAVAVLAIFVHVNNDYGFYASWADLFGQDTGGTVVAGGGGLRQPLNVAVEPALQVNHGRLVTISIKDSATGVAHSTLVWLPVQYDQPGHRQERFPVVMFLPGEPSTPTALYNEYDLGTAASAAIASGAVKPFVLVMPPLTVVPHWDTECTDIAGGPAAESWLAKDVTGAVTSQLRVLPTGAAWSVMGWSTGGFCAAKLLLNRAALFGSAVGLGGYYATLTDNTTGRLFPTRAAQEQNSPIWLYKHHGLQGRNLLMITASQDRSSYSSTQLMIRAARGDRHLNYLILPDGGHNLTLYRSYLPDAFAWLGRVGVA